MAASMRPPLEVESDDEESGDWEEWQAARPEEDEAAQCLFCREQLPSSNAVFRHCAEVHLFDFLKLRADVHLDFYNTLSLINFIRSKVRDYIHSVLYEPHLGYFAAKSNAVGAITEPIWFNRMQGRAAYNEYLSNLYKQHDISWFTPVEVFQESALVL